MSLPGAAALLMWDCGRCHRRGSLPWPPLGGRWFVVVMWSPLVGLRSPLLCCRCGLVAVVVAVMWSPLL